LVPYSKVCDLDRRKWTLYEVYSEVTGLFNVITRCLVTFTPSVEEEELEVL